MSRRARSMAGLTGAACAACCAGPGLALLTTAVGTAAAGYLAGLVGLVVALAVGALWWVRRRRAAAACASSSLPVPPGPVAVATPRVRPRPRP